MKAHILHSIGLILCLIITLSGCEKQSTPESPFNIEALGNEPRIMLDIDDITFEQKFGFNEIVATLDDSQGTIVFGCSVIFIDEAFEYMELKIKLEQPKPFKLNTAYDFQLKQNYSHIYVQTDRYYDHHTGWDLTIRHGYEATEGSIEFLKFEDDRIWAKFNFKAVDLPDGGTLDVKNGFLVNIKSKKL